MKKKFKTNINCSGCVAKVTPFLSESTGITKWDVDIKHPNKILTVEADNLSEFDIKELITNAGFKIEEITS